MAQLQNDPKFMLPTATSELRMTPQATPRAQLLAKLQKQQDIAKEQQKLAELDATSAIETPTITSDGA